jgi:hypothetical protein
VCIYPSKGSALAQVHPHNTYQTNKRLFSGMKRKLLTETPVCPRERLVIISYTTVLSFAKERIGPLAAIVTPIFYLFALYLFALPNTPENSFASIYSEALIKTTSQHLLLLVGFDTLIYRKYYPLYLWVISTPSHFSFHKPWLTDSIGCPPTFTYHGGVPFFFSFFPFFFLEIIQYGR